MSRKRVYHQDSIDVMQRFFSALLSLSESGTLKGGLQGYCADNNIDRRHLYIQKEDLGRGYFQISWVIPLIKEYRVSPSWLLMGAGPMFV